MQRGHRAEKSIGMRMGSPTSWDGGAEGKGKVGAASMILVLHLSAPFSSGLRVPVAGPPHHPHSLFSGISWVQPMGNTSRGLGGGGGERSGIYTALPLPTVVCSSMAVRVGIASTAAAQHGSWLEMQVLGSLVPGGPSRLYFSKPSKVILILSEG